MSNSAMYALSLDQTVTAITQGGMETTILAQGDMGTGKSTLLKMLAELHPNYVPCYFDCTTKDLGDITIPDLVRGTPGDTENAGYVTYLTNEELGVHHKKPIILMIDEYGKANPSVKNALLRLMLERKIGSRALHPDSLVFATTNKGAEGVGDLLQAHQRNRITLVQTRKPDNMEWIEWGLNNNIDHTLLGWCKDTPQLFHGFEDYKDPDENEYIFHPRSVRTSFVTPRSLEAASKWMQKREHFDNTTLTGLLMGTIGDRGAMDLMAYVALADQMPTLESIKQEPLTAKIPTSAAGVCMVVFRTLGALEAAWINPWMDYLNRLDVEAQGMFANGVRSSKYKKQSLVMTNKKFTEWAMKNNYLFAADKK